MTDRDETHAGAFIRTHTEPARPPLVPELTLHTATEITPLGQATEAWLKERNLPPPFWAFPWAGGQGLARLVLDRPELVRGRRVVDFATGSGLVALAAAKAGAAHVLAVEIDPVAVTAVGLNAALNGLTVETLCADIVGRPLPGSEVVLTGDVCYERPMAERVTDWLRDLAAGGALVLMGDPGRAYLPREGLIEEARYTVPTTRELEDRDERLTTVWRVAGSAPGR